MLFTRVFNVLVKPNSRSSQYLGIDERQRHVICLKEKAEDNKANIALIKFFRKTFNLDVRIKLGLKSKEKVLEIVQ
jgi:uncharacterized protein (TIGR00251 family)